VGTRNMVETSKKEGKINNIYVKEHYKSVRTKHKIMETKSMVVGTKTYG
jgi:hypothetical protein